MAVEKPVSVDLDRSEAALVVGEDDEGGLSVRVLNGSGSDEAITELGDAPELVLALATRLMKDPDFQDDVLDWYYEHMEDEDGEEEDEAPEEE
ncbi:MAG: hypothetical protein J0I21_12750 [Alphaproteobacteria bacterium]|nr:hypothetical protein [Alphaproteobacteria bacterium]